MSDRTPTLQQLSKALKSLENWFVFGVKLDVPHSQLTIIKKSHHEGEIELCKIDMFQYWLDNKLVPTWNEVIRALEETDKVTLASQIKHDYLLSPASEEEGGDKSCSPALLPHDSSTLSPPPAIPDSAAFQLPKNESTPPTHDHSSTSLTSTPPAEIQAEIRADVAVVSELKELEGSFGDLLVRIKRLLVLNKCDLSDALLFLDSAIGSEDFARCDNFDKLMRQLQRDHIDVFNISILQRLVACFDNHELTKVIEAYNEKKENFLKHTTVLKFQRAVVSRVKPILTSGMAVITIKVPKKMARHCNRTLKDIEELAIEGFEECYKKFIRLHAELGSIIISWVFPKGLSGRLEQLARDNAAVFKDNGVVEVTVGGRRVFPCTQQEDMASSQGVSEKEEEKSKLKQLYIEFYQQLVEAVSDPNTCHSLTTQLHSTSLLSEEKKAVLSSSLASGRSFLKVLGVEEEPHLVTVLMEKMSAVKQLQTLSEDMSGWLSGSKQGAADTQFTGKQAYYERIERQQIVADIERLTSDKTDLLTRLQCCEEDLKTASELLSMREKAISGMMAAVHRRDTDVEEREERISHLKKELEELRREGVERESLLTREIEGLKSKLMTKTDELNEAIKSNSELSIQIEDTTHQLENKDVEINALEAQFMNFQDSIANLHKESSQTELAELTASPIVLRLKQAGVRHIKLDQLRITQKLGSGNFSRIYEAEWKENEEEVVAIKIPRMKNDHDQAAAGIKEIENEVLIMSRLEHLNIVRLLGVTDAKHFLTYVGHFPMIVMEFARGGSLRSLLERQEQSVVPTSQVPKQLEIMYLTFSHQIAKAMEYLVEKSVVHRDLAARGVLVISDSHVKISSFGLARQCFDGKDYYRSSGDKEDIPVFWYAPECLEKLIYSQSSDVWSFGITMWEMFTIGHKPQQFLPQLHRKQGLILTNVCAHLVNHYKKMGPSKLPKLPTCPDNVYNNIITKCWTFDPKNRPTFRVLNKLIKQQLIDLTSTA